MKKVLYITYDGLADPLGQSQILPYIKGLSSKELQFTILSFEKEKSLKLYVQEIDKSLFKKNISWIKVKYHKGSVFLYLYDLILALFLVLIQSKKYDIILARSYVAGTLGVILKKIMRSKFVFDMRGFWPEERIEGGLWTRNNLKYNIMKYIETILLKKADHIITLTQKSKIILLQDPYNQPDKHITVIPTCVDQDKFYYAHKNNHRDSALTLCYSGSLGTWYCLDEMIEFFTTLKKYYPAASLQLLINWTSWDSNQEEINQKLSRHRDIKVKSCSYDELPKLMSNVHIGFYFIKPTFSKQASCPTKLGEFLAMGLPVITNRGIGDCDEWIENERLGILVNDFSQNAYKNAIIQLKPFLEDKEIINRCIQFSNKHLSLKKGIQQYKNILLAYGN